MSVIVRINNLIDAHEDYSKCKGCKLCKEIERLRSGLDREPVEKYAHILAKGQDMTLSDIKLLIEQEVQKRDISKAMGMGKNEFNEFLWRIGCTRAKKGKKEMWKMALTKEKLENHLAANRSVKEIAEMEGVTPAAVYSMKHYHGIGKAKPGPKGKAVEKLEAVKQEVKQAVAENPAVEQELRELIARLEDEVGEHKINEVFLNNSIKQLKEENQNLKASAEDTEQEAYQMALKVKELTEGNAGLEKDIEELETELNHLATKLSINEEKYKLFEQTDEKFKAVSKLLKLIL